MTPPPGLTYLTFSDEVVPLLKRGLIPLSAPEASLLPGYSVSRGPRQASVSDDDYQQHMAAEYQRLPANLQGLLTFEAFLQQAQSKRSSLEQAMISRQQAREEEQQGNPADWLWRDLYTRPDCAMAWSQTGFGAVWLGIDAGVWQAALDGDNPRDEQLIQDVRYDAHWPLSFPQRLWFDDPQRSVLAQQRLIIARDQVDKTIQVAGQTQWLLYLPPKAIRLVLLGGSIRPALKTQLSGLLQQDFRYQRIPLAHMQLADRGMNWVFSAVR